MEIRKRRRLLKPSLSSLTYSGKLISLRTLFFSTLSFLLLLFLFLFLSHHPPSSKLILSSSVFPELRIQSRILLPDSLLIFLLKPPTSSSLQFSLLSSKIDCVYPHPTLNKLAFHPSLSSSDYDDLRWLLRCPLPPSNYSSSASLQRHLSVFRPPPPSPPFPVPRWDWASYEAAIDGNTTVVFVKGFKLRPDKVYDPSQFRCRFESRPPKKRHTRNPTFSVTTSPAISAGQEIVRCPLPDSVRNSIESNHAVRVAVERPRNRQFPPSVARLYDRRGWDSKGDRYELCGCTMVWNQATALREWVTYHSWIGVQRWFIYDNNSDDSLEDEIQKLNSENYNLTRHSWPWIKSQEAGFSQCVMRAKRECNWVAFFDVDEFFYFPPLTNHQKGNHSIGNGNNHINNDERGLLRELVSEYSTAPEVGEIRTKCHSFGPSGLVARPLQGVTVGYTCRLLRPERHKSIVRTDAVDDTLLNAVHHFKLREGFVFQDAPEGRVLINHYKYQVWDVFKAKFSRRVSTYVADWQDSQNENSRDRAPGLGKEAIQPLDWNRWYCEVWDTGLRDFVLANLANPDSGSLPWEPRILVNKLHSDSFSTEVLV